MRTCPQCGEAVPHPATSCGACGADLPTGRPLRAHLISGLALAAIIAAAALLHSYLQKRVLRPPIDFLPSSTSAVIGLDVRRDSPAGRTLQTRWPADDRRILAERATELAQRIVDWTALPLDVREHAARWFDGELLAASIGEPQGRALGPRSFVLIARVTDGRHARGDLDSSAAELAREAGWSRSVVRSDGVAVTVWGEPGRRSEIAYATFEGCLIVSANAELLDLCLRAASDPDEQLGASAQFREACRPLPDDRFLWCYANTTDLLPVVRSLGPALSDGWVGFMRAYFRRPIRPGAPSEAGGDTAAPGRLAFALTAETDGLRVHANFWREARTELSSRATESSEIVYFAPPEAAALLLVHQLPDLVSLLLPESSSRKARWGVRRSFLMDALYGLLTGEQVPDSVLLTVAPQEDGDKGPTLAGAFAGAGSQQAAERLAKLLPDGKSVNLDGCALFASGDEGLRRLQQAAQLPKKRYEIESDVRVYAEARPTAIWPALGWLGEVSFTVRDDASGGRAELYLRAEPRYLLGGD